MGKNVEQVRGKLVKMIKDAGSKFDDYSISHKIRQIFSDYYLQNKEAIKEKSKNQYKNLSEEEKDKIKEH